jgi:hypothetical protein
MEIECTLRNEHKPWDDDEVDMLAGLYFVDHDNRSYAAMVMTLGRSKKAIQTEISRRGMTQPGAKLRLCIGAECYGRRKFFSASPAQRICQRCRRLAIYKWAS